MHILNVICSGGWMPAHLSEGWRRLGAEVTEFFYGSEMGRGWGPAGRAAVADVNRSLLATARQLRAERRLDMIFLLIYDDVLQPETANALRSLGVPLVGYHVDLPGQWYRVLRIARYFDRLACAQTDHWAPLRRAGVRPYYLPMAANPFPPMHTSVDFQGVQYLGSPWPFRSRVLSALARDDVPLRIFGHSWQKSPAQGQRQPLRKVAHDAWHYGAARLREEGAARMLTVFSRLLSPPGNHAERPPDSTVHGSYDEAMFPFLIRSAAINLGFTHYAGEPGTSSEQRVVRLRDFEVPMAGGFYLTQQCSQLTEFYDVGKHIETWASVSELKEKITYYLERPLERQNIAKAGRRHSEQHHTWESRLRHLLTDMGMTN